MTNEELMKQIKELKAQIKKLQLEAAQNNNKPMKRNLSDELIKKYGDRLGGVTLMKKGGINYKDRFFGKIIGSYSSMVRRRLFPNQVITRQDGNGGTTVNNRVFDLTDDQYDLYMLYMERLLEFLVEIDDALKGETT